MACHEAQALWALAADELPAGDRARVETHVAGCAACALELERVKQSREVLHEARAVTPDVRWEAVDARLRSAAARHMTKAAPRARLPWALALAGACAAMLGFWMLRTPEVAPVAPVVAEGPAEPVREDSAGGAATAHAELVAGGALDAAATARAESVEGGALDAAATARVESAAGGALDAAATARAESAAGAVLREAGGSERALRAGTHLRSGVAVRTPASSTALLRLPDASRVRLSAGSEVELSRAEARDVHLTVRQGRLSVQASHAERRGFLVEAAGLRVSVVGTVFTVERTERGAAVAVAEGRVRVEVEGQPARLVSAGERVELDAKERTLKHQPVSAPDQRAFEELNAPEPAPGDTVPMVSTAPDTEASTVQAVARAPQAPSAVKPAVATAVPAREHRSQVASAALRTPAPREPTTQPVEPPAPAQAMGTVPSAASVAVAAAPALTEPDQEFAPYPAESVTKQLPPKTAPAPEPQPPVAVAERPVKEKQKEPLIPMALLSKDADERFLGYARLQLNRRTCEGYLVGLEEIAQKSPRAKHREQARYLRARCFEEKLQPQAAQGEYRQYLNEFPRGRYVHEARTALLP
ncbi:FecR domain-containing protein [Myxococcus sp. RHSTA-1-4]|uniref:FecR domain-containing protein n=1 Tax=Myxococcus sp. RHSTA-1-4 TaxID=2874601 RepID=UPI001CC00398|nr:FecR domain-containing protein [Myxococcus sp. RHSTA-1-4]